MAGKQEIGKLLLASLSLAGLILTNIGAMDVIFRDVTILAATVSLAIQNFPAEKVTE